MNFKRGLAIRFYNRNNSGMNHRAELLSLFEAYCGRVGLSLSRVSTLVFNHGARVQRIQAGSDCTTRSFERAVQWFSDHWPSDLEWPSDLPRPKPSKADGKAAA